MSTRLRLIVSTDGGEPRIFDRLVQAGESDLHEAVSAAVRAFGKELESRLEQTERMRAKINQAA